MSVGGLSYMASIAGSLTIGRERLLRIASQSKPLDKEDFKFAEAVREAEGVIADAIVATTIKKPKRKRTAR
jgi:hypothetical protein